MSPRRESTPRARKLDRPGTDWPALAQDAANHEASFADFLEAMLSTERRIRHERKRMRRR